jgi:hypothetical protein
LNFLNDESNFYSTKVTVSGVLDRPGHQKDQAMIKSLEVSTPIPILQGKERGLDTEIIMDCAYLMKPS